MKLKIVFIVTLAACSLKTHANQECPKNFDAFEHEGIKYCVPTYLAKRWQFKTKLKGNQRLVLSNATEYCPVGTGFEFGYCIGGDAKNCQKGTEKAYRWTYATCKGCPLGTKREPLKNSQSSDKFYCARPPKQEL